MRRYIIFATAGLGLLMSSIDGGVVAVAFPALIKDFGTNLLWAAWTISIYFIAQTMAMPIMGNLSDSLGRKRVFIISLVLFTGSSLRMWPCAQHICAHPIQVRSGHRRGKFSTHCLGYRERYLS